MKKRFEDAECEIILMENEDVIITSGPFDGGGMD